MNTLPIFSVIIPTCERLAFLRLCLERLVPEIQNFDRSRYEIIVTDDRPSNSTRDTITPIDPLIRYTSGPKRGPAANRNHGASLASGDWLVFLDDDCVPEPGLLNAYRDRILEEHQLRVFEGRISALGKRTAIDQEAPINEQGGFLWSCNFCIERNLFVEMGGFDELFTGPVMEDVDFRQRLLVRKEPIIFVKQASVLHPWRPRRGFAFVRLATQARSYFYSKHSSLNEGGWMNHLHRFARGVFKNVLKEGPRYHFKGAWRYCCLELYTLFLLAGKSAIRRPKIISSS